MLLVSLASGRNLNTQSQEICCRCIDKTANCNNDIAGIEPELGLTCDDELECAIFDCEDNNPGCYVGEHNVKDLDTQGFDRQKQQCPADQKKCCNPVQKGGVLPLLDANQLYNEVDTKAICDSPKLQAVQDFDHGVKCGVRDARYVCKFP